ncbi:AI-2E family transporter [Microbacterium resistens]|uniref:AI-2E family transporter n=1 Tax=Microbacterium resistens TaxID=156977 RepID=A0ABY3RQP7_9MICO|nr:AI-2E family transporter [Microbacterium resistens]UGS25570.1 AI-2E family transporter [Microbacterium resistens]
MSAQGKDTDAAAHTPARAEDAVATDAADPGTDAPARRADPAGPVEAPGSDPAAATAAPVAEPGVPRASFWTRIDKPFSFGFLVVLGGLTAILLGLALSNISTVLIYIAFALFAALGLNPAVQWLEKRRIPRAWAVVIVIVGFAVVLAVIVMSIIPTVVSQIAAFIESIPGTIDRFLASDFYAGLQQQFGVGLTDVVAEIEKFLSDPARLLQIGGGALQVGGVALQVGGAIATGLSGALIVIVLTLYFLATLPSMKKGLVRLAPARDRRRISDISSQIAESVGGYVMGMVVLAFINAVLVFLLYLFLGLPFPPLMATVAFLITLIPLVGSVLFWIIGTGIALFSSPIAALVFALVYVVYMQVEAYVITPRVMNRAISIPGSLVVIGALVGGTLLGLLGALVAVPVTASLLIVIKQVWIPRQDSRV